MTHTVEKIGGTSMTAHQAVIDNILLYPSEPYRRILVVSAYSGITNALLECKKTGDPGIFRLVENRDPTWQGKLSALLNEMKRINGDVFASSPACLIQANGFIDHRMESVKEGILSILKTCQFSQFFLEDYLPALRELLAGLGEAHSAYNTALLAKSLGLRAQFVDLSGWQADMNKSVDDVLLDAMSGIDVTKVLPIVTGYVCCREGLMKTYDRGYSEMTLSRLAILTQAHSAVIHKEYHLSSADPKVVGVEKVQPLGNSNYDVADQLANLGMEAIHPDAASGLRVSGIELLVKNTFEPEHKGTKISGLYRPKLAKVQIIAGKSNVLALHLFDQNAVGNMDDVGYALLQLVRKYNLRLISKEMNANSLTYYLAGPDRLLDRILVRAEAALPKAKISGKRVALISVIGCKIDTNVVLSGGLLALLKHGISPKAAHSSMRNVEVQFVVKSTDYDDAVCALHQALIEDPDPIAQIHAQFASA